MFQAAGDEGKHDERCVNTLLVDVVSRLRQWGGVERRVSRRADVVGSKFGLSQIPPIANITNLHS